jgi:hypothetical protein
MERILTQDVGGAPPGMYVIVRATRDVESKSTLCRIKTVMVLMAQCTESDWPSDDQWKEMLPPWFLESFATHPPERIRFPEPWHYGSWLDSMRDRTWRWWSSELTSLGWRIWLTLSEWPYSIDAFEWLAAVAAESDSIEIDDFSVAFE